RYVFILFSGAARNLQTEFNMQPQTVDDQNGGVHPVTGEAVFPGSDQYPIIDCHAHPYSVSSYATMVFSFGFIDGTAHTAQWAILVGFVERQWRCPEFTVPQWFLDAPKKGANVYEVTGSEKSGYSLGLLINSLQREPGDLEVMLKVSEVDFPELREKVFEWIERDQQPLKLRHSKRIPERMARASSSIFTCCILGPAIFPCLKASTPPRSYHPNKSSISQWAQQNGHFPTQDFSSNDWAFFYYSTSLEGRITDRQSGT
ncbi:hypothetical protein EV122DRAFT_211307, partial [Schizophyllum commune]